MLLDTNTLSEIRKIGSGKANANVARWAQRQDADDLFVSVITLMEIERGILRLGRHDTPQADRLRRWLDVGVRPSFARRILPVDEAVALRFASLHVPDPKPDLDALIAATALVHGMAVATRNVADFAGTGVRLIDPWTVTARIA